MKQITGVALSILASVSISVPVVHAEKTDSILIVGIQTGSVANASEEKIILANVTSATQTLEGYTLEYLSAKPADTTKASRVIRLQGSIAAGQRFILKAGAPADDPEMDQQFASTLAAAGGHVRLKHSASGKTIVLDTLGWGTAAAALQQAAVAPKPGELLQRRQDARGVFQNTSNNAADFATDTQTTDEVQEQDTVSMANLRITELLPDPISPATDAADEFIEIFNDASQAASLNGLKLMVGASSSATYLLEDVSVPAKGYVVLYSSDTKLALSNSGSKVQLATSIGSIISEVSYPKAQVGMSWSSDSSDWRWSTIPTPGDPNRWASTDATINASTSKSRVSSSVKKTTKKATSRATAKAASGAANDKRADDPNPPKPKVHPQIIAGAGGLAVLYGAYEYRQDLTAFLRKLRGDRKAG